jgi:crossover junction endodeoxyribonuclease RuvC
MSLRVLGLDPGTATFGWGMVESGGDRPRYLAHGLITTSSTLSLGERLLQIKTELTQIARSERPDRIAIERIFTQGNLQSAVAVAAARGLALMIAAELVIEVVEATPSEMKSAIAGDGRASKSGVIRAVTQLLNIAGTPLADDAADALGLAIWGGGAARMQQLAGSARLDRSASSGASQESGFDRAVRRALRGERR